MPIFATGKFAVHYMRHSRSMYLTAKPTARQDPAARYPGRITGDISRPATMADAWGLWGSRRPALGPVLLAGRARLPARSLRPRRRCRLPPRPDRHALIWPT